MQYFIIFNILIFILNSVFILKYLHIYQLKDYNSIRYLNYFKNSKKIYFYVNLLIFLLHFIIKNIYFLIFSNIFLIILNITFNLNLIKSKKTPLKFTNKIKRLLIVSIVLLALLSIPTQAIPLTNLSILFLPILANTLNLYDKIKNKNFIKSAISKIRNSNAKIIAITGSNGKTSVKNILQKMLSTKYKVYASPLSYNTPLGISKFINETDISNCDFIILEYGARHKNDIKNLCKTFGADYGIITTISPQHLDSFKTNENIYKAKKQLSDFLQDRLCVFNIDNLYTKRMFDEKIKNKKSISIYSSADIYSSEIKIKNYTTHFKLHIENQVYNSHTKLLGRHNITNILLSVCLSLQMNISINEILNVIKNLEYTPHRLQLIKTHINILDDSYNCSLTSAKEALFVLKNFPNKKMVITPGIIEGGKQQYNINYALGQMLTIADYIVIVGKINKESILEGINSNNNKQKSNKKILFAKSLDDAQQYFSLLNNNDNLLFLNDLPDDYN